MNESSGSFDRTRRAVLRAAVAGVVGAGAAGTASGRPDDPIPGAAPPYDLEERWFRNAASVGHHSLGAVGDASTKGRRDQRIDGERNRAIAVHGDLAAVSYLHASEADPGRRLAILDVTEFNDATSVEELEAAELSVLSIHRSVNAEANSGHGVTFSADGRYVFLATAAFLPFTDGYHGGSSGEADPTEPEKPQVSGGVVAVDVSDPADPRAVDSLTAPFTTGAVNVAHQRIGGEEYVFACKDFGFFAPDSGVYVLRFDRAADKLSVVNRWSADGNTARGEIGTEHGFSYVHDVVVHEDPLTGRPTAYVADWNRGMRVLDVSEPTDIDHVGQFDAHQINGVAPFPAAVETPTGSKRVAVANHEEFDERFDQRDDDNFMNPHPEKLNPNATGTVFLVDCDGIYEDDGTTQLGQLDDWTWANADTGDVSLEELKFQRRHLSPHSPSVVTCEVGGERRFLVQQGHRHGGVRYLAVDPGEADGLTGDARRDYRPTENPNVEGRDGTAEFGWIPASTDWRLRDVGHARPRNADTDGLTPRVATTDAENGVTFAVDQRAGAHATRHEAMTPTPALPPVEADHAYEAGPTRTASRVVVDLAAGDRAGDAATVRVRDRLPDGWTLLEGDVETYPQGVRTAVEFTATVDPGTEATLEYVVEAPDEVRRGTFGPVEVSADGEAWTELEGTVETVTVGPSL